MSIVQKEKAAAYRFFSREDLPVRPGDEAFILGGPGHAVTAGELAEWWGTIPYEVTCLLGKNRAN